MMWKKVIGDELYVFFNGQLIYKRWLKTGQSLVFDSYGSPWSADWVRDCRRREWNSEEYKKRQALAERYKNKR